MLMLEYNLTSGLETLCAFTFHPNSIITNKITSSFQIRQLKQQGIHGNFTACWAFSFNKIT